MAKKNLLLGVKRPSLKKCVHCMAEKQNNVAFKGHSPSRQSDLLEFVHSDICGPLKVKSFGGGHYFVTFIDDHSRKI